MLKVRAITEGEIKKANEVARNYGVRLQQNGSCVTEDGKKIFYIDLASNMAATLGGSLGKKLKEALKADRLIIQSPRQQTF